MKKMTVLELCCFECLPNLKLRLQHKSFVLELCCFECLPNFTTSYPLHLPVLELCCFECLPNDFNPPKYIRAVLELCCFECLPNFWSATIGPWKVLELCLLKQSRWAKNKDLKKQEAGFVNIQSLFCFLNPSFLSQPRLIDHKNLILAKFRSPLSYLLVECLIKV